MRIVFMGSAEIACFSLAALLAHPGNKIVGVVTQPDRPKGRSLRSASCPVKNYAVSKGLPVMTPASVNAPDFVRELRGLAPVLVVVVAYGQILGPEVMSVPSKGCINLHMSLLPRYRGAAPIQWAIVNGDCVTGVTTMYINEKMDAGDIIYQQKEKIKDGDTAASLHDRLAEKGAALLLGTVVDISDSSVPRQPQDHQLATLAPKIQKSDGKIDWSMSAVDIHRRIRGFNPWPVCYCTANSGGLRVFGARIEDSEGLPGQVTDVGQDGPLVKTGCAGLRLLDVQPEGRTRMSGREYVAGYHPEKNSFFA